MYGIIFFCLGSLLVVIGFIGTEFESGRIRIPKISALSRIICILLGFLFINIELGFWPKIPSLSKTQKQQQSSYSHETSSQRETNTRPEESTTKPVASTNQRSPEVSTTKIIPETQPEPPPQIPEKEEPKVIPFKKKASKKITTKLVGQAFSYVNCMAISSSGGKITLNTGIGLYLFDIQKGIGEILSNDGSASSVAISMDEILLVSDMNVWDISGDKYKLLSNFRNGNSSNFVSLSSDSNFVFFSNQVFEISTKQLLRSYGTDNYGQSGCLSEDSKYLALSFNQDTKVFNVSDGSLVQKFDVSYSKSLAFTSNGKYLLADSGKQVKVFHVTTGKLLRTIGEHSGDIRAMCLSKDQKYVATGSSDQTAKLWDYATGKLIHTFTGHSEYVNTVQISSNSAYILTGSSDGSIRFWEIDSGNQFGQMFFLSNGDWMFATPDGFFDCSENAKRYVEFSSEDGPADFEECFEEFYTPGLLAQVMKKYLD